MCVCVCVRVFDAGDGRGRREVLTTAGCLLLHRVQLEGGTTNVVDCVQDELQGGAILQHAPRYACLVKQVLPLRSEVVNLVGRSQERVVRIPRASLSRSVLHSMLQLLLYRICITLTSNWEALILWVILQKEPLQI